MFDNVVMNVTVVMLMLRTTIMVIDGMCVILVYNRFEI
jgi:hypothetical protein